MDIYISERAERVLLDLLSVQINPLLFRSHRLEAASRLPDKWHSSCFLLYDEILNFTEKQEINLYTQQIAQRL